MKKVLFLIAVVFSTSFYAQELSYGVYLGSNFYRMPIKGDLDSRGGQAPLNLGLFGSVQINESSGVHLNAFYGKAIEGSFSSDDGNIFIDKIEVNKITTQLLYKYHVKKTYNQGFYLLLGPRLSFVSNAEGKQDGLDYSELYEKVNFGISGGFGFTFLKHLDGQVILDYGLPSTIDFGKFKSSTIGAYLNILIDIESIIKN
ncbi:outer membrane beta-barrel protein [Psychroserpens sp. XS_ASV72]|uniref:outer membrane beta-barrel protein n=1 Tax=Psychroserpens sp. XS_ASV72 TaxID=3241293 RepID=UPI003511C4EF